MLTPSQRNNSKFEPSPGSHKHFEKRLLRKSFCFINISRIVLLLHMIGFNHALTGALFAAYLPLPVAVPLALASHFVLDALPHYGISHDKRNKSKFWKIFFTIDVLATFGLALFAILDHHYAMFLGGLAGVIPDFLWVGKVVRTKSFDLSEHSNWFTKWHAGIQKLEKPWGLWIELPVAVILFYWVFFICW